MSHSYLSHLEVSPRPHFAVREDMYPFQIEGAQFLSCRRSALIGDQPGLGKTVQAIHACDLVGATRVLVVCPGHLRINWSREIERWSPYKWDIQVVLNGRQKVRHPRGRHMIVVNYDLLLTPAIFQQLYRSNSWDVLIIDEAHFLKTPEAGRTVAVYGAACDSIGGLAEKALRVWKLSGTITPNGEPAEIWTHLRATAEELMEHPQKPGEIMGYDTFKYRYGRYIMSMMHHDRFERPDKVPEFRELLSDYMIRRKKADVLTDLPPIQFGDLVLSTDKAKELKELEGHEDIQLLKALIDHEEATGMSYEYLGDKELATLRRLTGLLKVKPVADVVSEELATGTTKIVLFAWHTEVVELLARFLERFSPAVVVGGMSAPAKQAEVDRFQEFPGCRVFIGNIIAAGTGYTLTAASDTIMVEWSTVPGDNEQASLRTHRIGQKDGCLVRFASLAGTADEKVSRIVRRKTQSLVELYD